ETLPPTLHVTEPTPQVEWSEGAVELLTEPQPWPRGARTRRAGVSSFGVSGTNAHVVLEEAPLVDSRQSTVDSPAPVPWLVSARGEQALDAQVERIRAGAEGLSPVDVGFTLATCRAHFEHRAVLVGDQVIRGVATTGKTAF